LVPSTSVELFCDIISVPRIASPISFMAAP
jgi:hypothetical protein